MENEMDIGDVGASDAPESESGQETQVAAVTEVPEPALPTLPEPDENERKALEAALRSPAPVVAIPPAFNRPAAENQDVIAMAWACRRAVVPVRGELLAVRPKPSCKTCSGSARWTLIAKGQRHACSCVKARIDEAMGIVRKQAANQPPPSVAPASATNTGRAERVADLEMRLQQMQAQRDAVLVPVEARIEEHAGASLRLAGQLARLGDDQAELAAEQAQRERMARHYEELARIERDAVASIAKVIEDKRAAGQPLRAEQAEADRAIDEARGERERVIARWAERTRPTERSLERLRRKVELVGVAEQG